MDGGVVSAFVPSVETGSCLGTEEEGGGGWDNVSHGVSNETDAPVSGDGPIRSCDLRWTPDEEMGAGVWVELPQAGCGNTRVCAKSEERRDEGKRDRE